MVSKEKRFEYWNHFVACWAIDKTGGGFGVTGPKLKKIKWQIMADDDFWIDIVGRHSGLKLTPEKLQEQYPGIYEHCLGNFWGMVMQTLVEEKLIKG